MNIAQLRAFVSVVEHGSFSEAARVLGLSQPAVTMQVQALEADVGATLLERAYRRVGLTEAGRTLLPYAKRVLEELESAREDLENLSGTVTGRILLAASTTPGQYVLPKLLGPFLKRHPEVGVELHVGDTLEVVQAIESGEAHVGMTGAQFPGARARFEPLGNDMLIVIAPPGHRLAGRARVPLAAAVEDQFVVREEGSGTRAVFEDALRHGGVDPADLDVVTELGSSEAIVSAVEGGLGLGVVSRWPAEKALSLGTVAELDVAHFPVERPFYLVTPKNGARRAPDAFADFLRDELHP